MVTVSVLNPMLQSEALALADAHCAQYGKTATLKGKPRGYYYDYACIK